MRWLVVGRNLQLAIGSGDRGATGTLGIRSSDCPTMPLPYRKGRYAMKPFLPRKVSLLVVVVLLLAVSTTSFAALQGDPLKLGLSNTINLVTSLSGRAANS